jgi:DNA-binding NarL/FixJ family response regulator
MAQPKVLVADKHTLVADALKELLDPDFEPVGSVSDGKALLRMAAALKPDVIILELNMPKLSGMEAGPELKKLLPRVKLIVLTDSDDTEFARAAVHGWASAYLLKASAPEELKTALQEVLKGGSYITPKVAQRIEDEFVRDPRPPGRKRELTARQREVLRLLAEGKTMKETARTLNVTPRTIAFHKYRIMEDFALSTNSDLVKFALKTHVIKPL